MNLIQQFGLDPKSVLLTGVLLPSVYLLSRIVLREIKKSGAYLIEGLMYWATRPLALGIASRMTLSRYSRLQLAGPSKYLQVPGSADINLETDKIFVPLTLERPGIHENCAHDQILKIGNRIRIIGDPGSGKTSVIKRLLRDECARAIAKPSSSKLPLILELRNLAPPGKLKRARLGEWLLQHLKTSACKNSVYRMKECFDIYSTSSGLLVLLDRLDEVSANDYPQVEDSLLQLSERLSQLSENNQIVLTMRLQFHQQVKGAYSNSFPSTLLVNRFTPTDIYSFLTKWPFQENRQKTIVRIYADLTDRPTLRDMCANPLVLAMYVAEDQTAANRIVPESRTDFYLKVTMELLFRRRAQQVGAAKAPVKVREQRQRILGRLALMHLMDPDQPLNSLDWRNAITVVAEIAKCTSEEAQLLLRQMSKDTGLFTEERIGETFQFLHLTFCEFLAAFEAIDGQQDGWARLLQQHRSYMGGADPALRPRLAEVLPFAAGLLPRHARGGAIEDLFKDNDYRLLTLTFLETKLYHHPLWASFVSKVEESLLAEMAEMGNGDWLRNLYLYMVVMADAAASVEGGISNSTETDRFFTLLATRAGDSMYPLISSLAQQDAIAAFRVSTAYGLDLPLQLPNLVISNCDQPPFLAVVYQRVEKEPERINLWAILLAEASLRSPAVMDAVARLDSLPRWSAEVEKIRSKQRWFQRWSVKRTFLSECLTLACQVKLQKPEILPLLTDLKKVPAPGSMKVGAFVTEFILPLFLIFPWLIIFTVLTDLSIFSISPPEFYVHGYYAFTSTEIENIKAQIFSLLFATIIFLFLLRWSAYQHIYKSLFHHNIVSLYKLKSYFPHKFYLSDSTLSRAISRRLLGDGGQHAINILRKRANNLGIVQITTLD